MKPPSALVSSGIGAADKATEAVSRQIALALGSIRFGSVEITVHDGRVVQIEKREKVRLETLDSHQSRPTA
jgi:hypothetical protein